jgi:hypothetical protein
MSVRTRYLATTLALLAIGLGFGLSQWWAQPAPPPPVRAVLPPGPPPMPPATAADVLERAAELQLSSEQAARLQTLAREWQAETRQLEAAIRNASAEFEQFVADARKGGGASMQELQRRSGDLQSLSAELRERRRAHSQRAAGTLTDAQRAKLRNESLDSPGGRA